MIQKVEDEKAFSLSSKFKNSLPVSFCRMGAALLEKKLTNTKTRNKFTAPLP